VTRIDLCLTVFLDQESRTVAPFLHRESRPTAHSRHTLRHVAERIIVPFSGEGSGVEELSWGQQEIWSAMRAQHSWLPIGAAQPLPAGTTIDQVAADLRYSMSRYQTMRTRLRIEPGGRTRQVVADAGEVALDIVDAAPEADPAAVAEQVRDRYYDAEFDFERDWPVRVAVIRHRGALTHRVDVMSHLVTDGFGAMVLTEEIGGRDPATLAAEAPPAGMQPMEQTRWQRSPAGVRENQRALRYWENLLRTMEPHRFTGSDDERTPRHWQYQFASPALHLATRALGARTGVDASPVMLAVFAMALTRVTGISPVVVQLVVSNRFRRSLAESVSPVNQGGLCVVDVAGLTLDEAITHAAQRTLAAYKHAYYDPLLVDELIERIGRERGVELDLSCYVNDRRPFGGAGTRGPAPEPDQIRAALPATTFVPVRQQDDPWERLFVHIENVPGTMELTVHGDTRYLAPRDIEALCHGMEAVAVEAALSAAGATV
jgi:hypothetical protein